MTYSKPEVKKLASSIEAIQSGTQKVQSSPLDSPQFKVRTINAYEADE